jgi:Cu-Zn family superoxide dismutase
MSQRIRRVRRGAGVAACLAIASMIAGCSMRFGGATASAAEPPAAPSAAAGQVANLRSIGGSSLTGRIRVIDRGDNATILVSLINVPVGAYRMALHETPNCTSPNAFSAGAPWAPVSAGKRPQDLIPTQYANSEAIVETELRIAGLHANGVNGVAGRSVVVYAGPNVGEIRPDVPNAAMACGVFEPVQLFSF